MKIDRILIYILLGVISVISISSCEEEEELTADYQAPDNLPANLQPGSEMNDAILELYDELGIVVYTDTSSARFYDDLVSHGPTQLNSIVPADTAAVLFYISLIKDELYNLLPEDSKYLTPRNFYLLKSEILTGTGYYKYGYKAFLWENSHADLTVGNIDASDLDSTYLKESLIYGLSAILRGQSTSISYYNNFQTAADDAGYYWSVFDQQSAYSNGFVSGNQNEIMSDAMDFDIYAAWGVTTPPNVKDSLFSVYPNIEIKYNLVAGAFRTAGIPIDELNAAWQNSGYNPDNN